mgnify:CR=1 FL=1
MDLDTGECAHRSLHDLWCKGIGGAWSEVEVLDAEPVRRADDRTEVPWILDAVKEQTDTRGDGTSLVLLGEDEDPKKGLRLALRTHTPPVEALGYDLEALGAEGLR